MNKKLKPIHTFILFIGMSMMIASMPSICNANNFDRIESNADSLESILVNVIIDDEAIKLINKYDKKPVIPFGKKIVLSGSYKTQIEEIEIRQIFDDRDQTLDVKVSGNNWYAITGPFSPNQEIALIFSIKSVVTDEEKEKLIKNFTSDFENFRNDLFNTTEIDSDNPAGTVRPILQKNLSQKFKNYTNPAGNTLREQIIETLLLNNMSLLVNLVNSQELVRSEKMNLNNLNESLSNKIRADSLSKMYENSNAFEDADKDSDLELLKSLIEKAETDSLSRNRFLEIVKFLDEGEVDSYKPFVERINLRYAEISREKIKSENLLKEVYEKTIQKIESADIIGAVSMNSSFGVKDIEHFAGFDLGPTYINSESSVSTMFTASIYFGRNEVNKDLFPHRDIFSKNFFGYFKERVSLTSGIGITTPNIDKDSPLFFIGAGYRLNRIFRINAGLSFHRTGEEDSSDFIFNESIGISVNFRYISDLLQIFNSTTSSL